MMAVINLEAAVYWGQLSGCKPLFVKVPQYSCTDVAAYGAVAAFTVLLMLCQLGFSICLINWRDEFIDENGLYGEEQQHMNSNNNNKNRNLGNDMNENIRTGRQV